MPTFRHLRTTGAHGDLSTPPSLRERADCASPFLRSGLRWLKLLHLLFLTSSANDDQLVFSNLESVGASDTRQPGASDSNPDERVCSTHKLRLCMA